MGVDDFDALSVTDSGVFSDNDGCSSGRSSPVSCKETLCGGERERFAILTYEQVKRIDSVLNEMVALEGRGNFPALELKLKDLLTAVKDRLLKEGLKIRDIRLNGGAASYALMPETLDYCFVCGYGYGNSSGNNEDAGLLCSCNVVANVAAAAAAAAEHCTGGGIMTVNSMVGGGAKSNCSYNDIDLIFGMELSTAKHFDRVKTAVLDALLDLLPPQVSRKRMSACALKEAYVSKMVKVCEGDRWSLIALGNGTPTHGPGSAGSKGRGCSVELKFVDTMRRQYEFSVDSFQIVLDSLMLFYKCATVPMSGRFYPTIVGESVYGDFNEALFHLHHGLIATRHPEEIRGGGLLKYCNLLVRGYRPADIHSIQPLQRYMCSRFFIDFPEVDQQELKLRTYLANHMSGVSVRLRYAFLITLYNVVDSSTVCLMGHERRLTLQLVQRLACQLFTNDYSNSHGLYAQNVYYPTYYMQTTGGAGAQSQLTCPSYDPHTVYYNQALLPGGMTVTTASVSGASAASPLSTNPNHNHLMSNSHHSNSHHSQGPHHHNGGGYHGYKNGGHHNHGHRPNHHNNNNNNSAKVPPHHLITKSTGAAPNPTAIASPTTPTTPAPLKVLTHAPSTSATAVKTVTTTATTTTNNNNNSTTPCQKKSSVSTNNTNNNSSSSIPSSSSTSSTSLNSSAISITSSKIIPVVHLTVTAAT